MSNIFNDLAPKNDLTFENNDTEDAINQQKLSTLLKNTINECLQSHGKFYETDNRNLSNIYARIRKENGDFSKISNYNKNKLKSACSTALKNGQQEAEKLRRCLELVHELRRLKDEQCGAPAANPTSKATKLADSPRPQTPNSRPPTSTMRRGALMVLLQKSAARLPLYAPSAADAAARRPAPPLCGARPADERHVCRPGDLVAAKVKGADGDENWILAEVKKSDDAGRYDVEDIDEEQKERYSLTKRRVVPLPRWRAQPLLSPDALFPANSLVWALYPQTTCFYKGVVNRAPRDHGDPYLVSFEDATFLTGFSPPMAVPQRYVLILN